VVNKTQNKKTRKKVSVGVEKGKGTIRRGDPRFGRHKKPVRGKHLKPKNMGVGGSVKLVLGKAFWVKGDP